MNTEIPRIVISGGPCGGKSTALAHIVTWCQDRAYHPLILPEAATHLMTSGFERSSPHFQEFVWRMMLHYEQLCLTEAARYKKPVLIYDRGLADNRAYMSESEYDALLGQFGITQKDARDTYNGVIFMRSAAVGAEEFYTTENNPHRFEGLDEARQTDRRTEQAWFGTPHLHLIENIPGQSFEKKIHRALKAVARTLGVPEPLEMERKFVFPDFDCSRIPTEAVPINITQAYLVGNKTNERVRARGQDDNYLYFHTIKKAVSPGITVETEREISRTEYDELLIRRDVSRQPIFKTRYCFSHQGHYCELDVFHGRCTGLTMLEIEVGSMDEPVSVPPYLGQYTEETGNPAYSNYELAK